MTEDDYIKREAALEAIDRIRLEVWLIDIPSPTVPEYIEHHEGIQRVLGEIDALRKKVEQLPGIDGQKPAKWIPCKERLPRQGQEVICQCRANMIKVLKLDACGDWYQDAEHCYMSGFVVAWMPLPEPYEEGEQK